MARVYALRLWLAVAMLLLSWSLPQPASADRLHRVKRGQTLSRIAKRYRINVMDLALANRIKPKKPLRLGQELMIPPRGVTFVRPGQTLSHIARAHRCSIGELKRINRIRKSTRLRVGMRIKLPGYDGAEDKPQDWGKPERPGVVKLRRGGDTAAVPLVDGQGRVYDSGLATLGAMMRRHEADAQRAAHPRLARLLATISDHFGGREVSLISGFRASGGYTRQTSRHIHGRAADIRVAGVSRRLVWEYCRSLANTGCGYYPRSTFVHVDARPRHGQWVDWSRPGKRRRYGTLRRPYSKRMRRNPKRPRVTRKVRHPDAVPLRLEVVDDAGLVLRVSDEAQEQRPDLLAEARERYWSISSWPPRPL